MSEDLADIDRTIQQQGKVKGVVLALVISHDELAKLVKTALEQIPFPPGFNQDLTVHIRDAQITSVQCEGITRFIVTAPSTPPRPISMSKKM
jgi:hypothetical protein